MSNFRQRFGRSMLLAAMLLMLGACAPSRTQESTGEFIDDSVITTQVKAAIMQEPTLKVAEINVETFKGEVQLSGFVSSQDNARLAVRLARTIAGVTAVKNDMRVK